MIDDNYGLTPQTGESNDLLLKAAPYRLSCLTLTYSLFGQAGVDNTSGVVNLEKLPEFEVATIKPTDLKVPGIQGPTVYPGGRVVIRRASLKELICIAFDLSYWQIAGGDEWTRTDSWDVEALPPERSSLNRTLDLRYTNWEIKDKTLRQMLQALLIERFALRLHSKTRPGHVYLLEQSGKPLRLKQTKVLSVPQGTLRPAGDVGFANGKWVLFNTSLPELAKFANDHVLEAPVFDATDLEGSFDYSQQDRLSDSEVDYANPSNSFLLLIREVGLKLKISQGTIQSFVIDHADKPSPN